MHFLSIQTTTTTQKFVVSPIAKKIPDADLQLHCHCIIMWENQLIMSNLFVAVQLELGLIIFINEIRRFFLHICRISRNDRSIFVSLAEQERHIIEAQL